MDMNKVAERALGKMTEQGFDSALVCTHVGQQDELNIAISEASLLRSTEDHSLELTGIVDGRKAATSLTDLSDGSVDQAIAGLIERAQLAPQDDANAVSSGETANVVHGPQDCDLEILAVKAQELLDYRASNTPKMSIDEGVVAHSLNRSRMLTSEGSDISTSIGCYSMSAFGTATDGENSSSFNYAGGNANDLSERNAAEYFGIGDMLRETENQIATQHLNGNFVGDVVLAPTAVTDLLGWLLGQVSDMQLISDSSLYKNSVGKAIASPMISISSHYDGAGQSPISSDAFVAEPVSLIENGELKTLLPSLYGSRKTGIAHRPRGSGWKVASGDTSKDELIANVKKGALVTRLSMGYPGPNGDFSGVIKNSFLINDGELGSALSEAMISGNIATMLKDINGVSKEHIDTGGEDLPWIRIPNLNFS
jgi:PmbA protein